MQDSLSLQITEGSEGLANNFSRIDLGSPLNYQLIIQGLAIDRPRIARELVIGSATDPGSKDALWSLPVSALVQVS